MDQHGNGIRAEGESTVALVSDGTCFITGHESPVRIEGSAVVDTEGCAALDLGGVAAGGGQASPAP